MLRRIATTAACAIALTVAGPMAAHAESRTLQDGPGDVWAHFGDPARAPDHRRGDILRTVFTHNARQVVMRTKFVELDRKGSRFAVAARVRTNTGMVRLVRMTAGPGASTWRGSSELVRADNTTPVDCATSHRVDYAADVVVLRVPRTCLGDPSWVQATLGVASIRPRGFFADNPVHHGPTEHLPEYTARIRSS